MKSLAYVCVTFLCVGSCYTYGDDASLSYDYSALPGLQPFFTKSHDETFAVESRPRYDFSASSGDSLRNALERWRPRWQLVNNRRYQATLFVTEDSDEYLLIIIRF